MLQFTELYDYILGILHYFKRHNELGPFSLKAIIDFLDFPASPSDVNDIARYLEAEGYIKTNFTIGDVYVSIAPAGIVYIENKNDILSEVDNFLKTKLKNTTVHKIAARHSKSAVKKSRKPVIDEVDEIIRYFNSIKELKNTDQKTDARILRLELQKDNPDHDLIINKVEKLSQFEPIRKHVSNISDYLYDYAGL